MTKHTLTYVGIGGRAEPIRLAFAVGGVPYTNKVIGFPEFMKTKDSFPMGQVPILDVEDGEGNKKLSLPQSKAILRYVGKIGGLYPKSDDFKAAEIDMAVDAIEDASDYLVMTVRNAPGMQIQDEPWPKEKIEEIRKRLLSEEGKITYYCKTFEDMLVKNKSGWFVGDSVTIADLKAHHFLNWLSGGILDGIPTTCLDAYPTLKAVIAKVEDLPQVVAFRAKHGKKYEADFDFIP